MYVNLANDWCARGLAVEFVLLRKQGELIPLLAPGVVVTGLGVDRIRGAIWPLATHLRKSRPEVIITAMWPLTFVAVLSWLLAGKTGRMYVSDHTVLSVSCVEELRVSPWYLAMSMRLTYGFATGVVAVSQGVKDDLCHLSGLQEGRVKVLYNPAALGVSPHREPHDVRERLWGSGFRHHILSVGALKVPKDYETMIRAFATLPNNLAAKLVILGEGPLRAHLSELVRQLGLQDRVELPGFMLDPYPWFRSADLFVLSSRWEGFGNVLVEAMECGVPVVSTDCPGGPAEILEHGRYGELVPVRNPEALGAAMMHSLSESHDREALMRRAKDFSADSVSSQYLAYMFPAG